MAFKYATLLIFVGLLLSASSIDGKKYQKARTPKATSGWRFFGGGGGNNENEEAESRRDINKVRNQILQRIQLEKQRNQAVLLIYLNQPLSHEQLTSMTNHWKGLLSTVNINVDTFVLGEDRVICRVENSGMVNDVKNFLIDEPHVKQITVEEKTFSGRTQMEQEYEMENENENENEMEQEGEMEQEKEEKKSKKSKKSKKKSKSEL